MRAAHPGNSVTFPSWLWMYTPHKHTETKTHLRKPDMAWIPETTQQSLPFWNRSRQLRECLPHNCKTGRFPVVLQKEEKISLTMYWLLPWLSCSGRAGAVPGLSPSCQPLCLLQSSEFYINWTQDSQRNTPSVDGDRPLTTPIHSRSDSWPCLQLQAGNKQIKNMHVMEVEQLMPRDDYKGTKENQDPSLFSLAHPDLRQPLHWTDTGSWRQKSASDNASLGGISLGLEEKGKLDSLLVSTSEFPDITILVADINLPQLFNFLTGLD